jgi:hypothetical protein
MDPDNGPQPLSYLWNFGDTQTSTAPGPSHTYAARGYYLASLTVSDGADSTTSPQIPITVGHAPVPVITSPASQFPYQAGDTISFSGNATDAEDGVLPPSAFSWSVVLVHLSHTHAFLGPVNGVTQGSFVIPATGHDPEHTYYRIDLTVRDSDGTPATTSVALSPRLSPLSFDTYPSGIPVFIDGRALQTPYLYNSLVGFHHQISAQDSFLLGGSTYRFTSWSSGQPSSFALIAPTGGATLTAAYTGCYPNCDGSTGAPVLNVVDFTCFLQRFARGDPYANCDGSTGTPALNVGDFTCFLQKFALGCP